MTSMCPAQSSGDCCGSPRPRDSIKDSQTMAQKSQSTMKVNMAIESTFTMPFDGVHTPRTCLLRSVCVVLFRSLDKDWNVAEETKEWGLGEFPCLLSYDKQ